MSAIGRATFRDILPIQKTKLILITNSDLPVLYCFKTKGISKYKKVSKDKKEHLIKLILKEGQSIIESARKLGINYSTAKSIILSHKKRKINDSELDTSGCVSNQRLAPATQAAPMVEERVA